MVKIQSEEIIPKSWYNILPDLPKPLPPMIDPVNREPVDPKRLERLFAKELVRQEFSSERFIKIPEEVREVYLLYRPTPLYRARRLEKALKTPAKIYYKYEGVSPPGSHKPNTAIAQAYYNAKEGIERLTTETGAGQWGSALAFGCMFFGLKCTVYMVKASYYQKPYRRTLMQVWGAEVYPSPSDKTNFGRRVLKEDPNNPGSLGIAISEAIEDALTHENTKYSLGSVLNHVLMHQTVIGLETLEQMRDFEDYPDIVVGCIGGGSSFSGLFWPFYYEKIKGKAEKDVEFLAVEPTAVPSVTKGIYTYDHGDSARLTPLIKMYTLGHDFVPDPIHAGGLRYHGMAPTLSLLASEGIVKAVAYNQVEVFKAAEIFARTEGFLPAPEPAHAIKAVLDEAMNCKKKNESKTILFLLCGHGYFDIKAYEDFLEGKLPPYEYPKEKVDESIKKLKELYPWVH
ncbi:MAG: TrpB-like pyridoxal phosphate-dependent enzyme [Archaeoglobaceae archaeon]|nr:TrpB-like pyridoxal phosphate-dependent enzyme [Archaeoglobaceae archaeon]MCX8151727.1 TrpB-like pyridoxal phosphate-dependent enzyme [Archaeoglobaceae archaeon]MDW8013856.1 TrpB-like pyridoxal phosphate-dependent enzyme [Archaeoglobaceae archaeon]